MSQLNLNREVLVQRFGPEAKLKEVFKQIEDDLKENDEVVCQFSVNGILLAENDEIKLANDTLEGVEVIQVFAKAPSEVLTDVLKNWLLEIPRLAEKNDQLSQEIKLQGIGGQLKSLVELIDSCQLLIESIMSIESLFPNLEVIKSEDWTSSQKMAASAVGEALHAFQKKDFNLMADVLEYDLGHSLQIWMELLGKVQRELAK